MGNYNSTNPTQSLDNDNKINQLFFLNKCKSLSGDETEFYKWCSSDKIGETFSAKCTNIYGATGDCDYKLSIRNKTKFYLVEKCNLGSKIQVAESTTDLVFQKGGSPVNIYQEIQDHCYYWLNGKPFPWWAVLLIVLAIVAAFSTAAWLAWKYWLQKRWSQPKGSTLESRWTSTPVSSVASAQPPSRFPVPMPSQRHPSNTTSQQYKMNSGGMASQGSGSMGSRKASQRSNLSRSDRKAKGGGSTSASRKRKASGALP